MEYKQMLKATFLGRIFAVILSAILLGSPLISDTTADFTQPEGDFCGEPLDFNVRPMMLKEHTYTHYFPQDTWQPQIDALREKLSTKPQGKHPRLFPSLAEQQFRRLPVVIRKTIIQRTNETMRKGSESYLDLTKIGESEAQAGYARFLNQALLDLLAAWKITNNTSYAQHAERMCRALIEAFPPESETDGLSTEAGQASNPHAVGELLQGLAIAYDLLHSRMDADFRSELAAAMSKYVTIQLIRTRASFGIDGPERVSSNWWVPYHNWTAIIGGSMGLQALVLEGEIEGFDPYPALWTAYSSIEKWLDMGFDEKGATLEGNHYFQFAYAYALPFIEAMRARGGDDLFASEKLKNALDYQAGEMIPVGSPMDFNAWSTSHYTGLRWDYVPLLLARVYNQPLGVWIWEKSLQLPHLHALSAFYYPIGMQARNPIASQSPLIRFYSQLGMANFRTGWSEDDLLFTFSSGTFHPTTHGHSDENNFTLYAYGERFAVETGPREYGSEAHNTILVDGKGQSPSGGSRGVDGRIVRNADSTAYSYVLGDAKSAYDRNTHGQQGIRLGRADRHIIYVKGNHLTNNPQQDPPPYFIIYDYIQRHYSQSSYTWLLYSDSGNRLSVNPLIEQTHRGENVVHSIGKNKQNLLELTFLHPKDVELSVDDYKSHPRLKADVKAVNPHFLTVALPVKSDWTKQLPELIRIGNEEFAGGVIEWGSCRDFVAVNICGQINWQGIKSDAKALHLRTDDDGKVLNWLAVDAAFLEVKNDVVFRVKEKQSVVFDGKDVLPIKLNTEHSID
jgi:hypothetical protein